MKRGSEESETITKGKTLNEWMKKVNLLVVQVEERRKDRVFVLDADCM